MVVARSSKELFPYVLECDRGLPPEKQTTFHLRRLSTRTMLALENLQSVDLGGSNRVTVRLGDQRTVTLRAGLAGWDNFAMGDGTLVEYRSQSGTHVIHGVPIESPAAQECIDRLEPDHAKELVEAIIKGNTVTPEDVGN